MKRHIIYFGFFLGIANTSFSNSISTWRHKVLLEDTVKKIYDIEVQENPLIKGLENVDVFDIYNKTLFLIIKDRLVELNIETGIWSVNPTITSFLKKIGKQNKSVGKIIVRHGCYYLSILNDLYKISPNGEVSKIAHTFAFILDFNSVNDEEFLIATQDSIELVDGKEKLLNVRSIPPSDASGYIWSSQGIGYSANSELDIYEYQASQPNIINVKKYAPISLVSGIQDPFISYMTEKYLICFSYYKRNAIYILRKDETKNSIFRTINLKGTEFAPTKEQILKEEGYPNFKVVYENQVFYILAMSKGKLKIVTFTL